MLGEYSSPEGTCSVLYWRNREIDYLDPAVCCTGGIGKYDYPDPACSVLYWRNMTIRILHAVCCTGGI